MKGKKKSTVKKNGRATDSGLISDLLGYMSAQAMIEEDMEDPTAETLRQLYPKLSEFIKQEREKFGH